MNTQSSGPSKTVDPSQVSVGDLLGEVTRDMSMLVRQEVELAKAELRQEATKVGKVAKAELRQEATKVGKVAGISGAAGLAGFMVLLFLSFALWWGLANLVDQGWAALIVGVIWAVIAAVLFTAARNRMRQIRGLPQTTQTAREVPAAFKGH